MLGSRFVEASPCGVVWFGEEGVGYFEFLFAEEWEVVLPFDVSVV